MPRVNFTNMGRFGIIKDRPAQELPFEAWSDGNNVRFYENCVQRLLGHETVWTPTVDPWWLLPIRTEAQLFWLYANSTAVYVSDQSGTQTDITRAAGGPYAANFQIGWNGGVLNGIPVVNNGVDVPQMWTPPTAGTDLQALTGWDANYRCRVIRPLRNFLVALDITKSGTRYPLNVLWSHSALPGAVPSSWDTTDATLDAGEQAIAETAGFVLDMVPLKDVGIVYKEDATWIMQFVGGNSVFKLTRLRKFGGLFTRHCARPFDLNGEKHFVVTQDDVIVHDGQISGSVIDARLRRWLFNQIDLTNYQRLHVAHNPSKKEMMVCIPASAGQCTRAALWNYYEDRWSIRDLPSVNFVETGLVAPVGVSGVWDSDTETWDSDSSAWDESMFLPTSERMLFGIPGSSRVLSAADNSNQFNGVNFNAYVERTGLAIVGQDRQGNPIYDTESHKLCTEIWPRVEAPVGSQMLISVAKQDEPNDPITWVGPFTFTVGTDKKVNPMVGGKLLGVKFEFNGNAFFKLFGFDMELQITGRY